MIAWNRGWYLVDEAASVAAVERRLVEDGGVLDVVARVAHDGHHGVLAGRQLLEVDELDGARLHHGPVRVHQVVEQRVDAVALVQRDRAHRLFAHGALVRVARTCDCKRSVPYSRLDSTALG